MNKMAARKKRVKRKAKKGGSKRKYSARGGIRLTNHQAGNMLKGLLNGNQKLKAQKLRYKKAIWKQKRKLEVLR